MSVGVFSSLVRRGKGRRGRRRRRKEAQSTYSVGPLLVPPGDAAREPGRQQRRDGLGRLHRQRERGVPVAVLADAAVFVAGVDQEFLKTPSHTLTRSAPFHFACFNPPLPPPTSAFLANEDDICMKEGACLNSRLYPTTPIARPDGATCWHCRRNPGSARSWGCFL